MSGLLKVLAVLGLTDRRCRGCGRVVAAGTGGSGGVPLCPECVRDLAPRRDGFCPGCGSLFDSQDCGNHLCGQCRTEPRPWDRLAFFGAYDGRLGEMMRSLKFHGRLGGSDLLQRFMVQAFDAAGWAGEAGPEVVVPVPLHPRRLRQRGFNQSLELCRRLSRERGLPLLPRAAARSRLTPPQSSLGARRERQQNIRGAFLADPAQVAGRRVLLADDILTTGATLEELARTLRSAGAASVSVLVLLRA